MSEIHVSSSDSHQKNDIHFQLTPIRRRKSPLALHFLSRGLPLLAAACALALLSACGGDDEHHHHHGDAKGHHGNEAAGDHGVLRFSYTTDPSPVVVGKNSVFLTVTKENDQPLEGATIELEPFMPGHGHGSSDTPEVSELEEGEYRFDNVVFQMPGEWTLSFAVHTDSIHDEVTFVIQVK